MLRQYLCFVFLATLAVAEIPSYIKICGRRDPNLDQCAKESVEGMRDNLRIGIPELDIPPVEPLKLVGFPFFETPALKVYANDVELRGLTDFVMKNVHIDLVNDKIDIALIFKKIILDANYDVNARIVFPIAAKGPFHFEMEDVQADVTFYSKRFKKNGVEKVFFTSMTTKLKFNDFIADFKTPPGADPTITEAINTALKGPSRQEILESIKPAIEKVVSTEILKLANKVNAHLTYDEIFPDRE